VAANELRPRIEQDAECLHSLAPPTIDDADGPPLANFCLCYIPRHGLSPLRGSYDKYLMSSKTGGN
jgi:hypothetical protein